MKEKKKHFISPEAEITKFTGEDIITVSVGEDQQNWYEDGTDGDEF